MHCYVISLICNCVFMRNETEVPFKIMSVLHCSSFALNYAINTFFVQSV